jgi:hypothetical protein
MFLEEIEVDFYLTYDGPLPGEKKKTTKVKHEIRRQLHEQLQVLVEDEHSLSYTTLGYTIAPEGGTKTLGNVIFIPLITSRLNMICEIDILFLRREPPGSIMSRFGGDLDNRLKIFLDALRMPHDASELPEIFHTKKLSHCFCLLEDDALVTGLSLKSGTWLNRIDDATKQNDVRLIVKVSYGRTRSTDENRDLI